MLVYVMISAGLSGQVIVWCGKNFNVGIFSNIINVMNVKLCMMVLFIEFHLFELLSVTCFSPDVILCD